MAKIPLPRPYYSHALSGGVGLMFVYVATRLLSLSVDHYMPQARGRGGGRGRWLGTWRRWGRGAAGVAADAGRGRHRLYGDMLCGGATSVRWGRYICPY